MTETAALDADGVICPVWMVVIRPSNGMWFIEARKFFRINVLAAICVNWYVRRRRFDWRRVNNWFNAIRLKQIDDNEKEKEKE